VVVLPQPDGPQQREELAGLDAQVDAVDGDRVAVPLAQVDQLDHAAGACRAGPAGVVPDARLADRHGRSLGTAPRIPEA
jgi:hypothetical protein